MNGLERSERTEWTEIRKRVAFELAIETQRHVRRDEEPRFSRAQPARLDLFVKRAQRSVWVERKISIWLSQLA